MPVVAPIPSASVRNATIVNAGERHNERTANLLANVVLPVCQYFAYLEVGEHDDRFGRETALWRTYKLIAEADDALAMRRVRSRSDIYPVFRELFSRTRSQAA